MNEIQSTIDKLTAEKETLAAAVAALSAQRDDLSSRLDALLADAERNATKTATEAATEAETALITLDGVLRRKRAALAACLDDLAQAHAEFATAQRAAVIAELATIHAEYEQCSFALESNIGDLDAWGRLAQLATDGNRLFHQVRTDSRGNLFTRPTEVRGKLLAGLSVAIDRACGLKTDSAKEVTPAALLEVERTKLRIQNL